MTLMNFNADTPQLEVVKGLIEAYYAFDMGSAEPFVSKDYKFQTFPKIAGLPDEPKGGHFERYGVLFSLMTKAEYILHEKIEAPGKVVVHHSVVLHTGDGEKLDYDSLTIFTLIEEDGKLKVSEVRDFSDPEKRGNLHGWAAKALYKQAT